MARFYKMLRDDYQFRQRTDYEHGGEIWYGLVRYAYMNRRSPMRNYTSHPVYNRELELVYDYFDNKDY